MSLDLPFHERACLVAGSAKSGSTLLVALLDGHPDLLVIPEESAYFPTVRRKFRHASRLRQAEYLVEEAETRLLFEVAARDHGNRDYRSFPREEFRREFLSLAGDPSHKSQDLLSLMAGSLARVTHRDPESIRWWIEKTPANRWCVPEIRSVFPRSRLLLTMRDPRAVASAVLKRGERNGFKKFSLYLCVKYWAQSAKLFLGHRDDPLSCGVRFEEMLRDPDRVMRDICVFLDIDFRENLIQPTKGGNQWRGNSTGGERFSSISTTPIERWKTELARPELAFVERLCSPWMQMLGYEPVLVPAPGPAVLWQKYRCESTASYLKDRRRLLGDCLVGFWSASKR